MEPISIVIPVYNEADVIEKVVRDFYEKLMTKLPGSELIIAEDGSTDGTREILHKLKTELDFTLISGTKRKGYTKAVLDALKLPDKNIILFSDSDGQQEPNDFWTMYEKIQDYDMVIGYKCPRRDPFYRVFISRIYQFVNFLIFGIGFHDINCGFRLMKKDVIYRVIDQVSLLPLFVSSEFVIRAIGMGYKVCEVPVTHYTREFGSSRGLPLSKIPKEVIKLVIGLLKLKRIWKKGSS